MIRGSSPIDTVIAGVVYERRQISGTFLARTSHLAKKSRINGANFYQLARFENLVHE